MKTALGWLVFLTVLYALAYGVFGIDWVIFGSEVTAYEVRCCQLAPSRRTEKIYLSADGKKQLVARLVRENPAASKEQIVEMAVAETRKPVIEFDLTELQRRTFKVYPSEQRVVVWNDGGTVQPLSGCAIRDRHNWSCQAAVDVAEGFRDGEYFRTPSATGTYYVSRFQWWQFKLGLYRSEPSGPNPLLSSTPPWGISPNL